MKKCGEGAARVSLKVVKSPFDEIMDTKIGHLKLRCSSYLFSCKWHSLSFLIALIGELVISLNLKLTRVYPQLFKEDPEVVHPVFAHMCRNDNTAISQLHEVHKLISYIGSKMFRRCDLSVNLKSPRLRPTWMVRGDLKCPKSTRRGKEERDQERMDLNTYCSRI